MNIKMNPLQLRGMEYKFILMSMLIILLSISAVNGVELNNMTTDSDLISLDIPHNDSLELLDENEKYVFYNTTEDHKSNGNNSIFDFNSSDYNNISILSNDSCFNINGLTISISDIQSGNLQSNGVSGEIINLINSNTYAPIYSNNIDINPIIKAKYDLRDYGYVSSVKSQNGNSCWAHAALSSLESCILKAVGVEYDFSEVRLSKLADEYFGDDGTRDGRGNIYFSMGYLTSWLGAVKENFNPNDPVNLINIQNTYIITSDNFRNNVKNAILNYGAVVASYYHNDSCLKNINYYCNDGNYGTNHEIAIVGWDDNYNKNNFKTTPGGDGAWICKNSYGSSWGDNGYFYISYYDKTLGKNPSYTFILNDSTKYNKNYQYDIQPTDTLNLGYAYYKNSFTSQSNEKLVAISSYFDKSINYTISINVNNKIRCTQNFKSNIDGYFTVKLNNMINLKKGQKFEVIIKNPNNYSNVCNGSYIFQYKLPTGVSYVSKDGTTWTDAVSKHNVVCCIKAFTTTSTSLKNRPNIVANDLTKYYGGSENLTIKLTDYTNKKIQITVNGKTYSRTVNNDAVASMKIGLPSGDYPAIIKYSDSNFDLKITISITIKPTIVGSDITKYYKNDTQYYVTCYDSNGNLLKNSKVQFNINGVFYTRTTNASGVAKLNINLGNGDYIITATNTATNENHSNNIKVLTILEAKDLRKRYGTKDQFNVTLLDGTGKPYVGQTISININGVFYNRVTDNNGVAHLNINLKPGSYIATASFNGLSISRNIIVYE